MQTRRALFGCGFTALLGAAGKPNAILAITADGPAPEGAFANYHGASPDFAPWLASVLTARFPHAAASANDEIQHAFKKAGYTTALVGRWPDSRGEPAGFDVIERDCGSVKLAPPYFVLRLCGEPEAEALVVRASPRWLAIRAAGAQLPSDVMISSVDLMPTMLGLLTIDAPNGIHGRDAFAEPAPESVYIEGELGKPGEWRSVVRGLDRIYVGTDRKPSGLFNLEADPEMKENLVNAGPHRRKRDEMMALLRQWALRTGDRMRAGR